MGHNNLECIRLVIARSALLTSEAAKSLAIANSERDLAIGVRDAAIAGAKMSHASLVAEIQTSEVAKGERDVYRDECNLERRQREEAQNEMRRGADERVKLVEEERKMKGARDAAISERDLASEEFRDVILGHFDPSQIVLMLNVRGGTHRGGLMEDVGEVRIDDIAKGAVDRLELPDLIWLFDVLTTHWATTFQERVDSKVRSVCNATGLGYTAIPRALTADGFVELEAWLRDFETKVISFVHGIRMSSPAVVSGDKIGKRRRKDVSSAPAAGGERGDLPMIQAFGAIQTSSEVSHFDFLGAFLSVQRMLITCAAIEAGLLGIEATAAMTPARFGRQMRRAYV